MGCGVFTCDFGKWSPTGKPVATSSTPVERNPEREPPAKAGARVEGLGYQDKRKNFKGNDLIRPTLFHPRYEQALARRVAARSARATHQIIASYTASYFIIIWFFGWFQFPI